LLKKQKETGRRERNTGSDFLGRVFAPEDHLERGKGGSQREKWGIWVMAKVTPIFPANRRCLAKERSKRSTRGGRASLTHISLPRTRKFGGIRKKKKQNSEGNVTTCDLLEKKWPKNKG